MTRNEMQLSKAGLKAAEAVHDAACRLTELANLAGLVVTIERRPLQPLVPTPWDALLQRTTPPARFDRCREPASALTTSKAGQVRNLLRNGPMSAAAICMEVDIPSTSLVGPVLKHDLAMGRIRFINGLYELASEFEQDLQQRIKDAAALLVSQGYRVVKP